MCSIEELSLGEKETAVIFGKSLADKDKDEGRKDRKSAICVHRLYPCWRRSRVCCCSRIRGFGFCFRTGAIPGDSPDVTAHYGASRTSCIRQCTSSTSQ